MDTTGIWPIREYARRRQAKIAEYLVGRPIYEIFTCADQMEGSSRLLGWLYQEHDPKQTESKVE